MIEQNFAEDETSARDSSEIDVTIPVPEQIREEVNSIDELMDRFSWSFENDG